MHTRTLHPRNGAAAIGLITLTLTACGTSAARQAATTPYSHQNSLPATTATPSPRQPGRTAATHGVIGQRATGAGQVLVNAAGLTLYTFAVDRPGHSACTGACAVAWPPVIVSAGDHLTGQGRLPERLGVIVRDDGQDQASYDARPLYTFTGDHAAGQTHGQGIKGVWFVARTDGQQPAPTSAATPPATGAPVATPSPTIPARPPTARPVPSNPIPQAGGGDGDADNLGGPNDGDGNK